MRILLFLLPVLFTMNNVLGQEVYFDDIELKAYLINELCIDTSNNGFPDIDADLNNDTKIQLSEALSTLNLHLDDFLDNYEIRSLQDLDNFENLRFLKIVQNDSIKEVSNLNLDSLKTLWIGSCHGLKVVDISNLIGLTDDLRVEDIDTLDYLNIQNGNKAEYFSLFYTEHIHYVCVDSILEEFNEAAWRVISGVPQIEECEPFATSVSDSSIDNNPIIDVFPNPSSGIIEIKISEQISNIQIYDLEGRIILSPHVELRQIDLSHLKSGIYILWATTKNNVVGKKIVIN